MPQLPRSIIEQDLQVFDDEKTVHTWEMQRKLANSSVIGVGNAIPSLMAKEGFLLTGAVPKLIVKSSTGTNLQCRLIEGDYLRDITNKILIRVSAGNTLEYLPLDIHTIIGSSTLTFTKTMSCSDTSITAVTATNSFSGAVTVANKKASTLTLTMGAYISPVIPSNTISTIYFP